MRVNIYAEEMTDRVEIVSKEIDGQVFTGLRFYLELPVTCNSYNKPITGLDEGQTNQVKGPFIHHPGDDDSAAVTFWGKQDLRGLLRKALAMLDAHYASEPSLRAQYVNAIKSAQIEATKTCNCPHPPEVHGDHGCMIIVELPNIHGYCSCAANCGSGSPYNYELARSLSLSSSVPLQTECTAE